MPLPLMVLGGVALAGGGVGLGMLLSSGSTATNITETTVNSAIDVTNRSVLNLSSRGRASNTLLIADTAGDVTIDGLRQSASVTMTVDGFLKTMNTASIQQEIAQQISQMAEAVTSGIPLGPSEANNTVRTYMNTSASVLNSTEVLCSTEGDAENTLTILRTGGSVSIRDVEQNAAVNTALQCVSDNISNTEATQKVSNTIDQTAIAIVKGLDPMALFLLIIAIVGGVVLFFAAGTYTLMRAPSTLLESVANPKVMPLVIVIVLAVVAGILVSRMRRASKDAGFQMTCRAEMESAGTCLPADHPTDPALQFPLVVPERVRPEMGRQVTQATATSLEEAVAAARGNPSVTCLLWERDTKTWTGFGGVPDPARWLMTRGEDNTLQESRYMEHNTRYNILELYKRGTNLLRGLLCIAYGVRGGFDPSNPDEPPSSSLCSDYEDMTSDNQVVIDGVKRELGANDRPKPEDFVWNPLGDSDAAAGDQLPPNFYTSMAEEHLFYLLAGPPNDFKQRFSLCIFPAAGNALTDVASCPESLHVRQNRISLLGFLRERFDWVQARRSQLRPDATLLSTWLQMFNELREEVVGGGFDAVNTGDPTRIETVRNVAVVFPARTGKGLINESGPSPAAMWAMIAGALLVLGTVLFMLYGAARRKAKEAAAGIASGSPAQPEHPASEGEGKG